MTDGATPGATSADRPLIVSRRGLVLFVAIAALWCLLSWFVVRWIAEQRITGLVAHETSSARQDVASISENFARALDRLQGLPVVLAHGSDVVSPLATFGPTAAPSRLALEARAAEWSRRPDLVALDRQLLAVTGAMDVDIIWVMNASGDCVAASNVGERTSFVGTNYADRAYFKAAQAGQRGRQYAMGRVTNVPGLFFSAPVMAGGRFIGAVAIKIDTPRLASLLTHPNAFVTDEYGVIILSADPALEMHALPGAQVGRLTPEQRQARYKRETFDTLSIDAAGGPGLMRVSGSPHPHVLTQSPRPEQGVAVYILAPIPEIQAMRGDALIAFLLVAFSGIMMAALAFGARLYLLRARQHRQSMEATNESLNKLNEHLDHLARIDPLTGCANRRHFQSCLDAELARSGRYGHSCALLVIDLDHFKQVNDQHGHAGGDEALRHFAQITREQLRSQDELGRLGGEEFAVLLPETGMESALAVAERIRAAVEASPTRFGGAVIPLTASFGVACWTSATESVDALLQRADAALYAAKSGGRNRVFPVGVPPRIVKSG